MRLKVLAAAASLGAGTAITALLLLSGTVSGEAFTFVGLMVALAGGSGYVLWRWRNRWAGVAVRFQIIEIVVPAQVAIYRCPNPGCEWMGIAPLEIHNVAQGKIEGVCPECRTEIVEPLVWDATQQPMTPDV